MVSTEGSRNVTDTGKEVFVIADKNLCTDLAHERRNMWDIEEAELAFKQLPYYKTIVKSFIQKQIQLLLEEMCREAGEESVIMTVNLQNGTMSHLGSDIGKAFLDARKDLKTQFLSYCISNINQCTSTVPSSNPPNNPSSNFQLQGNGKENHVNKSSATAAVTSNNLEQQLDVSVTDKPDSNLDVPQVHVNMVNHHENELEINEENHEEIVIEILHSGVETSNSTEKDLCDVTSNEKMTTAYNSSLISKNEKKHQVQNAKKKPLKEKVTEESKGNCNSDQTGTESLSADLLTQNSMQDTFLEIPVKLEEQVLEENQGSEKELTFFVKETSDGHIRIEPIMNTEQSLKQQTPSSDLYTHISVDDLDLSSSGEDDETRPAPKRKHNKFSILEKREMLEYKTKHPKVSQKDLTTYFTRKWGKRVTTSMVSNVLKRNGKWATVLEDTSRTGMFRFRRGCPKSVDLEEKLCSWCSELQSRNMIVSNAALVKKAKKIGKELGLQDFSYSSGWFSRFKKRNSILTAKSNIKKVSSTEVHTDQNEVSMQ